MRSAARAAYAARINIQRLGQLLSTIDNNPFHAGRWAGPVPRPCIAGDSSVQALPPMRTILFFNFSCDNSVKREALLLPGALINMKVRAKPIPSFSPPKIVNKKRSFHFYLWLGP